ncbi:MAG: hypothetical protein JWR63_3343 [Conexibacter sp.]|nr:hypothetical protein [Conexibacter sp.]
MPDLIGDLLRAGLLSELGDDPERATKLRSAADRLSAYLQADGRPLVLSVSSEALSESGDDVSGLLAISERHVADEWETLSNAFPQRPDALLRAVLLAALALAADSDPRVRRASWYALRSRLEEGSSGRWGETAVRLLAGWDEAIQREIVHLWVPAPASTTLRMPAIAGSEGFKMPSDLPARVTAAAQQVQYSQYPATLQTELGPYFQEVIDLASNAGSHAAELSVTQMKAAFTALGTRLREALEAHEQTVQATRRRTDLLWWRESAYSARLATRYRDLQDPIDVAFAAAADLYAQVPLLAPVATEHVLADLVTASTAAESVSRSDLPNAREANHLRGLVAVSYPGPVTAALADGKDAPAWLPTTWTPGRLAVLAFRDLQAARALDAAGTDLTDDAN